MSDDLIGRLSDSCYLAFEDGTNDFSAAQEAIDRIEELEAKLTKVVEIGNKMAVSIKGNYYIPNVVAEWEAVLAELEGKE